MLRPLDGAVLLELDHDALAEIPRPNAAVISGVKHLASYSWIESRHPIIVVPGSPPTWVRPDKPTQLKKDYGIFYKAMNEARHPDSPMEPLFRALDIEQPDIDLSTVDVICDRNSIRKLLMFVWPGSRGFGTEDFWIQATNIGNTVIFSRIEPNPTHFLRSKKAPHNEEFKKWTTQNSVRNSSGHHRIITYRFGGLNLVVRHESDAFVQDARQTGDMPSAAREKPTIITQKADSRPMMELGVSNLNVQHLGEKVPLSATLGIKTSVNGTKGEKKKMAQLWISQTPNLVTAEHKSGHFGLPEVEDIREKISAFETEHAEDLKALAGLLCKIVEVARKHKDVRITYDHADRKLTVTKAAAKKILPEDVYRLWDQKKDGNGNENDALEAMDESY